MAIASQHATRTTTNERPVKRAPLDRDVIERATREIIEVHREALERLEKA